MGLLALTFLGYTKYVIYFCSAFILLPGGMRLARQPHSLPLFAASTPPHVALPFTAGRDIIAPGKPMLPKDEEAFKYFGGKSIMWRVWGLLWYCRVMTLTHECYTLS